MPNPFSRLKQSRGLIPFFVLGDPDFDSSFDIIKTAIDAGADALELGLAFSDPIADGPIIQAASARALAGGMDFQKALKLIAKIRAYSPIPMNLLTYANPLYRQGFAQAFAALKSAGMEGVLIADLALEEADRVEALLMQHGLLQSFLIAPNTQDARAVTLHQRATAFTYLVNRLGTTGMSEGVPAKTLEHLQKLTALQLATPIAVGFGIHTPEQANTLFASGADAIIIGSKFCQLIEHQDPSSRLSAIADYIHNLKRALS